MNRATKILIVLFYLSLCGAGSFIASTAGKENASEKTNVMAVKNREIVRPVWIVT